MPETLPYNQNAIFPILEVNSRRLGKIIKYLIEQDSNRQGESLLSDVIDPQILYKVIKENNFWISAGQEREIYSRLSSIVNCKEILFNLGKDFFFQDSFDILPSDGSQIELLDFLHRLPLIIDKNIRFLKFSIVSYSQNHADIRLDFHPEIGASYEDLVFFRGLLEGCTVLFQLTGDSVVLSHTTLSNFESKYFTVTSDIKYYSDCELVRFYWDECKIKVGKTNLNKVVPVLETKTFLVSSIHQESNEKDQFSYIDLNEVMNKTRELYLENRDLEAAVEVLKSLRNELVIKQKSITKDLRMARNIQKGIIPQKIPDWQGLQFSVHFSPMQEVSGDYYDYFNFGSNRLGILVSDVSGHGVPAAFITAISKLLFTNYKLDNPSEILGHVNSELLELVKQQGYLTCFYGIIDSEYEITYSIAGHPCPILYRHSTQEVLLLEGEGTFLGMFDDAPDYFKDYKIKLEPGDKLFVFTDGLLEGQSDSGEQFQQANLVKAIFESKDMSIRDSVDHIIKNFTTFCRGTDQGDDITLLGIGLSENIGEFNAIKEEALRFFSQKDFTSASNSLMKAHHILPRDLSILFLLGKTLAKLNKYDEAISFLEEYNSLKTYNADSHHILGFCYYKKGNSGKAEIEFQRAISLRTNHFPALFNLARIFFEMKDFRKAYEILLKIMSFKKNNKYVLGLAMEIKENYMLA